MDLAVKLALYAAVGLVLILANLWFVRLAMESFSSQGLPDTIAPVHVVGVEDKDGKIGQGLAGMLLALLGKIRQEMDSSAAQLRTPMVDPQTVRPQDLTDPASLDLPERLFQPIDVDMKIGGVEVGGILNWVQRALVRDNSLQLSVQNEKGRAIVSGAWNGGKDTLWLDVKGEGTEPVPNDKIASAVAYALTQRQFAARVREVGAFTVAEFQELLGTLNEVATLQGQVALGRVADSDFAALFARIEPLVERTPRWTVLIQLAGKLADNGGKIEKAIDLYSRALKLSEPNAPVRAELEARIAKLSERLVVPKPKPAPLDPTVAALAAWPLNALAVESLKMPAAPRIAVLGGVPAKETLAASRVEIIGGGTPEPADPVMGEYIRTVVQAVDLVAPQAKFLFARSRASAGVLSDAQLLAELNTLMSAKPDILLVPFGPLEGAALKKVFSALVSQKILVVVPAGNERGQRAPFEADPLRDKVMTVASVGPDGKPSHFTTAGKSVFWAPGEKIPVRPVGRAVERRDGTAYSAALAAGVAARVLAEHPGLEPEKLLAALRETAQPAGEGKQPVLNLAAALKKLGN